MGPTRFARLPNDGDDVSLKITPPREPMSSPALWAAGAHRIERTAPSLPGAGLAARHAHAPFRAIAAGATTILPRRAPHERT